MKNKSITLAVIAMIGLAAFLSTRAQTINGIPNQKITNITESALALSDVTTANASGSAHGFLPKLPNDASKCFLGDGTYGTCFSGSSTFAQLAQVVTSGSATSVAFTSIPNTYSNLRIEYAGRTTAAVTTSSLFVQVNGDSTSGNYTTARYILDDTSLSTGTVSSTSSGGFCADLPGTTVTAAYPASGTIWLRAYKSATFNKRLRCTANTSYNSTTTLESYIDGAFTWKSTAAVTSITLTLASSNAFLDGSTFTLYAEL